MTPEQRDSVIRDTLKVIGGFLLMGGYISPDLWNNISPLVSTSIGTLMVVGPMIWGYVVKTKKGIIKSAENLPDVKKIVVDDPELADSLGPKVITQVR